MSLASVMMCTGCQVDVGGQTIPSAYYLQDDIQYFPTGPKYWWTREAANMKAYSEQRNQLAPPPAAQNPFPAAQ